VTELEERVTLLETAAAEPTPPSPTVQEVAELRTSIAHLEASLAAGNTRLRQVMLLATAALVLAIAAVILAVLVH